MTSQQELAEVLLAAICERAEREALWSMPLHEVDLETMAGEIAERVAGFLPVPENPPDRRDEILEGYKKLLSYLPDEVWDDVPIDVLDWWDALTSKDPAVRIVGERQP